MWDEGQRVAVSFMEQEWKRNSGQAAGPRPHQHVSHFAALRDILGCCHLGMSCVEAKELAQHATVPRTGSGTRNSQAPEVNAAQAEGLCPRLRFLRAAGGSRTHEQWQRRLSLSSLPRSGEEPCPPPPVGSQCIK